MKIRFLVLATLLALLGEPARAVMMVGVTSENQLVTFDSPDPTVYLSSTAITGLKAVDGVTNDPNAVLMNLAYNPLTNMHYGIDSNANFYSVGLNGVATLIDNTFAPAGFGAGFAWDPFTESFLFASDAAENVLIGADGSRTENPALVYGSGDANEAFTPQIFALGIDPVTGEAYFADAARGILGKSFDPLFSEIFTLGGLGGSFVAFGGMTVDEDGLLWGAFSGDGLTSSFYSLNTATGEATLIGEFDSGMHSIAVVPEPSTAAMAAAGVAGFFLTLRRRRATRFSL